MDSDLPELDIDLAAMEDAMQKMANVMEGARQVLVLMMTEFQERMQPILNAFEVAARRVQFYGSLPKWIPGRARDWIAAHWPEKWLPELDAERWRE